MEGLGEARGGLVILGVCFVEEEGVLDGWLMGSLWVEWAGWWVCYMNAVERLVIDFFLIDD